MATGAADLQTEIVRRRRVVVAFAGRVATRRHFLAIHMVDGTTFRNDALTSPANRRRASRAERIAAALEEHRQTHTLRTRGTVRT